MCPLFRPLSEIPTLGVGWATEFLSIPYYGRVVPSPQTVANAGNVLICLERGCVADQPQRCDWCFAHSRAPENLNEDTAQTRAELCVAYDVLGLEEIVGRIRSRLIME